MRSVGLFERWLHIQASCICLKLQVYCFVGETERNSHSECLGQSRSPMCADKVIVRYYVTSFHAPTDAVLTVNVAATGEGALAEQWNGHGRRLQNRLKFGNSDEVQWSQFYNHDTDRQLETADFLTFFPDSVISPHLLVCFSVLFISFGRHDSRR